MSEQDAVDKAQAAVGNADQVVAAAWLLPRGFSGHMFAGEVLGGGMADAAGGAGGIVGAAGGAIIGGLEARHHDNTTLRESSGTDQKLPQNALVGVSDSTIYCWEATLDGLHRAAGRELFTYPRAQAQVTVHGRLNVQTFEVVDTASGAKWEFESPRLNGHLGPVIAALGLNG